MSMAFFLSWDNRKVIGDILGTIRRDDSRLDSDGITRADDAPGPEDGLPDISGAAVIAWEEMRVDSIGDLDVLVAEALRDVLDGHAVLQEERGVRVPQPVQRDIEAVTPAHGVEVRGVVGRTVKLAHAPAQDRGLLSLVDSVVREASP